MDIVELTLKRGSTVMYNGVPFKVAGFREDTENVILEAWLDAPVSDVEIIDDINYEAGASTETCNTSEDFLFMRIHKKIAEQVRSNPNITKEYLDELIGEALE